MRRSSHHSEKAVTILEAVFAAAIMALFMGGLFAMNGRNIQLLKSGKESFSATVVLEERAEQLRRGKWSEITSDTYLQTILSAPPSSGANLPSVAEQIVISAYPPVSPALASTIVTRSSTGAVVVVSSNPVFSTADTVMATFRATWSGTPGGRTRVREISTVIANRGLITR